MLTRFYTDLISSILFCFLSSINILSPFFFLGLSLFFFFSSPFPSLLCDCSLFCYFTLFSSNKVKLATVAPHEYQKNLCLRARTHALNAITFVSSAFVMYTHDLLAMHFIVIIKALRFKGCFIYLFPLPFSFLFMDI